MRRRPVDPMEQKVFLLLELYAALLRQQLEINTHMLAALALRQELGQLVSHQEVVRLRETALVEFLLLV